MMNLLQGTLLPSGFATLLFLAGVGVFAIPRARHFACPLLAAAAAVLLFFSNGLVATKLISPLEYAYPAQQDPQLHPDVGTIVVLTAYVADDDDLPLSSRPNASSAFRILEAANLWSVRRDCRVIISGSAAAAATMAHQLLLFGVPEERLTIDGTSENTAASAVHVKALIGGKPLFLVTSAGHMRRALGVFRRNGMIPVPAPTDYLLPRNAGDASWTTSAIHLQASDLAIHEYIGLAWYRLRGQL